MLEHEYEIFDKNRGLFMRDHWEEFVVIQGDEIKGFFPNEKEALMSMKSHPLGTFLVQKCISEGEETARYVSRVVVFA